MQDFLPDYLRPGDILDEFQIAAFLGEGNAGSVYKARALKDGASFKAEDILALKIYKDWVLRESHQVIRIERELMAGASLIHQNLLRIHEARINLRKKFGTYLVMEYIDGITLLEWIQKFHPVHASGYEAWYLDKRWEDNDYLERATDFALQLCHGIQALHECAPFPILHRDLKPSNVMVVNGLQLKIMDYGVVKVSGLGTITEDDKFLGTIRNASPEYLFQGNFIPASDVYSLGTILYAMLSDKEVFAGTNRFTSLIQRITDEEIKVDSCFRERSSYCLFLSLLVESMIQKEPNKRLSDIPAIIEILKLGESSDWWYRTFSKWLGAIDLEIVATSVEPLLEYLNASAFRERQKIVERLVSAYYEADYTSGRQRVYKRIRPLLATLFVIEHNKEARSLICNKILMLDGSEDEAWVKASWLENM